VQKWPTCSGLVLVFWKSTEYWHSVGLRWSARLAVTLNCANGYVKTRLSESEWTDHWMQPRYASSVWCGVVMESIATLLQVWTRLTWRRLIVFTSYRSVSDDSSFFTPRRYAIANSVCLSRLADILVSRVDVSLNFHTVS